MRVCVPVCGQPFLAAIMRVCILKRIAAIMRQCGSASAYEHAKSGLCCRNSNEGLRCKTMHAQVLTRLQSPLGLLSLHMLPTKAIAHPYVYTAPDGSQSIMGCRCRRRPRHSMQNRMDLLQGLKGHDTLAELDVSLNHLKSDGAQHLARLIVTLPSLQQLHVAAIGMRADGLQALSMQVGWQRCVAFRLSNLRVSADAGCPAGAVHAGGVAAFCVLSMLWGGSTS
eukprot:scaffold150574_cov22-Tisochrysis_lutea.AAC.1